MSDFSFDCGICLGILKNPVTLACGSHSFCYSCARQWLSKQTTPQCPCCRASIPTRVPQVNVTLRDALDCIAVLTKGALVPMRVPKPPALASLPKTSKFVLDVPQSPYPLFDNVSMHATNGLLNSLANHAVASSNVTSGTTFGVQLPAASAPAVAVSSAPPKFTFGSTPGAFLSTTSAFKFPAANSGGAAMTLVGDA